MTARTGPGTAGHHQDISQQEKMAFAPDSSSGHDQYTGYTDTTEVIASEKGGRGEAHFIVHGNGDGIGSHDGTHGGTHDSHEGEDGQDEVTLPQRPILFGS